MYRRSAAIAMIVVFGLVFRAHAETTSTKGQTANHKLLEQKLAELKQLQEEIDQLRAVTGTAQQILVKVQVLEVSRSKMRQLGIDWAQVVAGKDAEGKPVKQALSLEGQGFNFGVFDRSHAFFGRIEALQQVRIAKVLAEPSLVVVSGRPATFEVGGEMSLPAAPNSGKAVDFQSFGTKLDVVALALDDKRIRLELRVRLSEPDYARTVLIEGSQVPAMNVRQIDTALELKAGQFGFLSGLVQPRVESRASGVGTETNEIETWFIVTPELVPAIAAAPVEVR